MIRLLALGEEEEIPKEEKEVRLAKYGRGRKYATSFFSELMILSKRNFYNIFRTHTLFLTRVGVTVNPFLEN
jgi:hypothetical protein